MVRLMRMARCGHPSLVAVHDGNRIMQRQVWRLLLAALLVMPSLQQAGSAADDPAKESGKVSYYRQVRPIFQAQCNGCHQPAKQGGKYVMTDFATLLAGGESGEKAVVPGKPDESSLLTLITPTGDEAEMPKGKTPLSAANIALIKKWISEGAIDDTPDSAKQRFDADHPPSYARPPLITSLDFSLDGSLIAVSGYSEVLLHKGDGSGLVARLVSNSERIETVRFSPDGKLLAVSGGRPGLAGELQIWDVSTHKIQATHAITFDTIHGVNWSPDGKLLAFGCSDKSVRAINVADGKQVLFTSTHEDRPLDTVFSQNGTHVVSVGADRTAKVTELATQRFIDNITSITPGALKGGINSVARHPSADVILVGGADGEPKFYEIFRKSERVIGDDANLVRKLPSLRGRLNGVALSRDGRRAAAVSSLDGTGQLRTYAIDFAFQFPPEIVAIQRKRVSERSADERKKVDEFTSKGFEPLADVAVGESSLYAVSMRPDGEVVAVAGSDGRVRLFDVKSGQLKHQFVPVAVQSELAGVSQRADFSQRTQPVYESVSLPSGNAVVALDVEPKTVRLDQPHDSVQFVVTARLASGDTIDVTRLVEKKVSNPAVAISTSGLLVYRGDPAKAALPTSSAELKFSLAGRTLSTIPIELACAKHEFRPDFIRDVAPVISKLGCNQGTCHGANKGKGGFKLSLRGNDPVFDVRAYTDELASRRVNFASPDNSLMLSKTSAAVPHEAGRLAGPGDAYYELLKSWIEDGAKLNTSSPRVARIDISPQNPIVQRVGGKQQFRIVATYSDGQTRDVTAESYIDSGNIEVAKSDAFGLATTLRRGEAAILARYEGSYAATTLTVMGDRTGFVWQEPPVHNFIDELTAAKWKRTKTLPSELCGDAEFLRRVSLDLIGLPPTADEVRAFLADRRDTRVKRDEVIQRLIGSPDYVEHWTNKWADLLQVNRKYLGVEGATAFREWIRTQVAANTPHDKFVASILMSSGSNRVNPAASFYKIHRQPDETMETTTHLFLGVRFNCNKCHDHPFERWTQDQYYETAAFFAQFGLKKDPESGERKIEGTAVEGATPLFEEVFDRKEGEVTHDRTGAVTPPKFPYDLVGQVSNLPAKQDEQAGNLPHEPRREQLARWATSPNNRYFARSFVNRMWSYLLGVGLIEPIDDIRAGNPPSNPELLDRLTQEFIASGFDVQQLIKVICQSRTYQLSVATNRWNDDDRINYSHALAKRLPAEVLFDTLYRVTGSAIQVPGVPANSRAAQFLDPGVAAPGGFLTQFGRPPRESPCECERSSGMQFGPVMSLVSGQTVGDAINQSGNTLTKLVASEQDDAKLTQELFLRILSRPATDAEIQRAVTLFRELPDEHNKLLATLRDAEAKFAPILAERETQRLAAIQAAEAAVKAHEIEIAPRVAELAKQQQERTAKLEAELAEYEASLPNKIAAWESQAAQQVQWTPLDAAGLSSTSATTLKKEADLSIASTNSNGLGTYKVVAHTDLKGITAIRLEVLADPRHPKKGPGRAEDGNFVLSELELTAAPKADASKGSKLKLEHAQADFSQQNYAIATAIDGKIEPSNNGWAVAPKIGQDHVATFDLAEPTGFDGGTTLTVLLHQQFQSGTHSIGRFRLSVTTSTTPILLEPIPDAIHKIVMTPRDQRSDEQSKTLVAFYRGIDKELQKRQMAVTLSKQPMPVDPQLTQLRERLAEASRPALIDPTVQQLRDDVVLSETQLKTARLTATQDIAWALINSPAFLFNR
jgi:WD40 repeat protein/mono/diheme cytochrome c family protein